MRKAAGIPAFHPQPREPVAATTDAKLLPLREQRRKHHFRLAPNRVTKHATPSPAALAIRAADGNAAMTANTVSARQSAFEKFVYHSHKSFPPLLPSTLEALGNPNSLTRSKNILNG